MSSSLRHNLLEHAMAARDGAYAPYSGFAVGCALLAEDGRIFTGCNIENASYPQGHCAERSAVSAMVTAGVRRIKAVCVIGSGDQPCTPCGGCRQLLNEFATPDLPVDCCAVDGTALGTTLGDLLPMSFGPSDLGMEGPSKPASAAEVIRGRLGSFAPRLGIVLGSGLGDLVDAIEVVAEFAFADLPGFPAAGVKGHAGRLVIGRLEGAPVACLSGRVHNYEGDVGGPLKTMVRCFKEIGCSTLLLTNAAGSLNAAHGPGSLVRITDHINLQGTNPLVGPNDDDFGPRFVDMTQVYDQGLGLALERAAGETSVVLGQGIYAAWLGPAFETPAEIRALRTLGADLVGMSTVPEVIVARHCGLRCAAISMVTNLASGMADHALSHEHTLSQAQAAAPNLVRLIKRAAPMLLETTNDT